MKLYEFGVSRSTRAHWVLREAGVRYETVKVDLTKGEQRAPEFLAINPYGKLPVLVDGDITVTESAAICTYIAEKFPAANLIPAPATADRAQYYQWVCFCIAEMEPHLWSIRKNMMLYPKEQRSRLAIRVGRMEYDKSTSILENHLSRNDHILGAVFSAADIVIAYNLFWANTMNLLGEFPVLHAYLERVRQRPAFPDFLFTETVRQGKLS
jgi:glutathione S-transferase